MVTDIQNVDESWHLLGIIGLDDFYLHLRWKWQPPFQVTSVKPKNSYGLSLFFFSRFLPPSDKKKEFP